MAVHGGASRRIRFGFLTASLVVAPWALVADVDPETERRRQQPGFVGVIGHWTSVDDGGPAFKVDGAKWSGQTPANDLQLKGKRLFPDLAQSFVTNGTADGAFPLAVWNPVPNFTEGTIRVQFKLIGGPSDQTAGVVIGLQRTGEYLFVRYNTKDGNVAVWAYADGQRRVLTHGENHEQLALGAWHELVVNVAGSKVKGTVNGKLSVEHTLDMPLSGRVGLWTKRDAVTAFKGYRVTP
jgi:hypothetical protein